MTKLQIYSGALAASRNFRICGKFLCTNLITVVLFLGLQQQISVEVNGFVLLELPLYKQVSSTYFLQHVKVQQMNPIDIDILMDNSTSATVDMVKSSFRYDKLALKLSPHH